MNLPVPTDYSELGLEPPSCAHWLARRGRYCVQPAVGATERCVWHGGRELSLDMGTIAEIRNQLTSVVVPVAMQRLMDIVMDPEAQSSDVVRAAFGIMDRVGLGPVQGLQIDANIRTEAPLAAIQALLTRVAERLPHDEGEILDAEVLE